MLCEGKLVTQYKLLLNRGGHYNRFDCNLIEVVTTAGLTVQGYHYKKYLNGEFFPPKFKC